MPDKLYFAGNGKQVLPILVGDSVLPPMETRKPDATDASDGANGKRKPNRRKAADRFAVLNAFVGCGARKTTA